MKTNFRKFFSVLAIAAMVSTAALMSCSEDEVIPIPDEVESTIENAYYITGIVTTSEGALSGVTVKSEGALPETVTTDAYGVYTLTMSNSSTATVTFSMSGYVEINATAIFASGATVGDAVTLSQQLTATVAAQAVTAGEDATLTFDHDSDSDIVISVPSTALTSDVEISATTYTPAATASTAEALAAAIESGGTATVVSALSAVYLEPSGTTFVDPVTISIPSAKIDGAYHAKMVDGEWVNQGSVSYNSSTSSYEIEVYGFSQHSIAVETVVEVTSSSSSSEYIVTLVDGEEIDNLGNVDAITESVSYKQHAGWEFEGDSEISSYVAGLMGSSASEATISKSLDVTAAGDEKVTVTITQQVVETSFTLGDYAASAMSYGDVTVSIETEQGDMRTDHNN